MNWFLFLYKELKWRKSVERDVVEREGIFLRKRSIKIISIIAIGLISSLLTNRRKKNQKNVVFVNFKNHSFASSFRGSARSDIRFAENSFKGIIDGTSLVELDAIYHLIHDCKINLYIKKLILSILLRWVDARIIGANAVFVVYEDFYGKSSILTTLSNIIPLPVVGIQHGIMTPEYLKNSNIYPGIRTSLEVVLNSEYKKLMEPKKRSGSRVLIGGSIIFQNIGKSVIYKKNRITFISSGDIGKENTVFVLNEIAKVTMMGDYKISVRPHPSEVKIQIPVGISIDKRPKSSLFELPCEKDLFIGYYSTLLYELSAMGYKTIWITNNSQEPRIEVLKLGNARVLSESELTANLIHKIFGEPIRVRVEFDSTMKDDLLVEICQNVNDI